jgi:hypothetical protein
MAEILDADVVLVGEEIGETVVDVVVPGEVSPCGDALVECVGPVLDAQP